MHPSSGAGSRLKVYQKSSRPTSTLMGAFPTFRNSNSNMRIEDSNIKDSSARPNSPILAPSRAGVKAQAQSKIILTGRNRKNIRAGWQENLSLALFDEDMSPCSSLSSSMAASSSAIPPPAAGEVETLLTLPRRRGLRCCFGIGTCGRQSEHRDRGSGGAELFHFRHGCLFAAFGHHPLDQQTAFLVHPILRFIALEVRFDHISGEPVQHLRTDWLGILHKSCKQSLEPAKGSPQSSLNVPAVQGAEG